MKVFYHNDLDGRCCAAILWQGLKHYSKRDGIKLIEIDYDDKFPMNTIKPGEQIYIVDYSILPEEMMSLIKIIGRDLIIWIDHHKTAIEKYRDYISVDHSELYDVVSIPGVRDINKAACELVWRHCYPDKPVPDAVKYVADRDTWKFVLEGTGKFYAGIMACDHRPKAGIWTNLLEGWGRNTAARCLMNDGAVIMRYRDRYYSEVRKALAFETSFEGYRCLVLNAYKIDGSDKFGEKFNKYDICVGISYNGSVWTVSLYSKTVDVGEIAKKYGGGGHKGASGFVVTWTELMKTSLMPTTVLVNENEE